MAEPAPEPPSAGAGRLDDEAVRERLRRLDELLERVEQVPSPTTAAAIESVQLLTEIYGEALTRMLDHAGPDVVDRCVEDELLRHLMVLHEVHPHTVEERVREVLDEVRAQIESQGVHLELLGIDAGVARIRVVGGSGCSAGKVDQALSESVLALAPELARVEPLHERGADAVQAVIPVEALLRRPTGAVGVPR